MELTIRMEEIVVGKNVQILDFFLQGEKDRSGAEERRSSERVSLSERKEREEAKREESKRGHNLSMTRFGIAPGKETGLRNSSPIF